MCTYLILVIQAYVMNVTYFDIFITTATHKYSYHPAAEGKQFRINVPFPLYYTERFVMSKTNIGIKR